MQADTEENKNANGNKSDRLQVCACCAALAQLRLPWLDVAVQHSAPHYPPYYGSFQLHAPEPHSNCGNGCNSAVSESRDKSSEAKESDTVFFKLSSVGRKNNFKRPLSKLKQAEAPNSADAGQSHDAEKDERTSEEPGNGKEQQSAEAKEANTNTDADAESGGEWQSFVLPKKPKFSVNLDLRESAIALFGFILPAFVLLASIISAPKRVALVALHHPVEIAVELMLIAGLPLANYLVWTAIGKGKANLSRPLIMALGAGAGTGLVIAGICFAALFGSSDNLAEALGSDFAMGFTTLSVLSLLSSAVSLYLVNRLRMKWELESSRLRILTQAAAGIILSILAFAAAEYRPWSIRMAQFNAISKNEKVRKDGLLWLRQINPEREMRMECADSRSAGLPGLFLPIKSGVQQQLYFTLTGTPYSFRDEKATELSGMSNDYLSRHVVGDKIPHMGLSRSSLNGVLHSDTLTATLNWTFVVKNENSSDQEFRAELGLPEGAAVTGLSVWNKGEPMHADFLATGKIAGVNTINAGNSTPGMVTDLGRGRVLVHCYPVPAEHELKLRVRMVVPMKPDGAGRASILTPQLIAGNFDMDGEQALRLRSKTAITTGSTELASGRLPGEYTLSGNFTKEQLETNPVFITANRESTGKPFAVLDGLAVKMREQEEIQKEKTRLSEEKAKEETRRQEIEADLERFKVTVDRSRGVKGQLEDLKELMNIRKLGAKTFKPRAISVKPVYITENISTVAAPAPSQLVVVLDGSVSMKKYAGDVLSALSVIPENIPTKVIVASQENSKISRANSLAESLPQIKKFIFTGGQDNLKAVVDAAELAGESKGGAVLWIHGPQTVLNEENYIMAPFEAKPALYELPLVAGTDTFEFFRNHSEIGPFSQVPRVGNSIEVDLKNFFARWSPDSNSYVAKISAQEKLPEDFVKPSDESAKELLMLNAVRECERLIATRHFRHAARIAVNYGFVSPVSSAYLNATAPAPADADEQSGQTQSDPRSGSDVSPQVSFGASSEGAAAVQNCTQEQGFASSYGDAPLLMGAINGTIGPQGPDATVIMGVNNAGCVRKNNLANLEALLNIVANMLELLGTLAGGALIVHGLSDKAVLQFGEDAELGPGGRVLIGAVILVLALMLPGVINWFVASARDANLFS